MKQHERKLQRLKDYDYAQNNAYFITICTQNRLNLFGCIDNGRVLLNNVGKMVEERLLNINDKKEYFLNKYVIMPNHIHAIIMISHDGTTQGSFPTLSELVQRFKTITTKIYIDYVNAGICPQFNKKIWQKSFFDRVIRNEKEYLDICKYIDQNPIEWANDELHINIGK